MSYIDFLNKRGHLKKLIEAKKTGTAHELSKKLNISRRTLFNYFHSFEAENKIVIFCRTRKTYCFSDLH
jgi:transcriptional antiterminator